MYRKPIRRYDSFGKKSNYLKFAAVNDNGMYIDMAPDSNGRISGPKRSLKYYECPDYYSPSQDSDADSEYYVNKKR